MAEAILSGILLDERDTMLAASLAVAGESSPKTWKVLWWTARVARS
jgi:hypothetical protein